MKYYSVRYEVYENGQIRQTETVGIKSETEVAGNSVYPILKRILRIEDELPIVVTDKLDIGEQDYYRMSKQFSCSPSPSSTPT